MDFESKQELLKEFKKAYKDTSYALRTYLETFDQTQSKFVPLVLFDDQESLIKTYETSNEIIVVKYRQAGVSTVTAAWCSKVIAFASKKKPERILIVANKLETATEFAGKIRSFLTQWPEWIGISFSKTKNAESHFKLDSNDCEVKAVATSKDALRGYTPTILIFDEAAYIEAGEDFWSACMASCATGAKVIVISTPNGYDPIYYTVYKKSLDGENDFKISTLHWYNDPRYTQNLQWIKCDDIIHYMLNREEYDDSEVVHIETDKTKFKDLIDQGYKPFSPWYEAMCKKLNHDKRRCNQELNIVFLGSGDNVFSPELIKDIQDKQVCEPKDKYLAGQLWVWKDPEKNHRYIMGVDVSRGDSEDFSVITIVDFDTREQVLEYMGKLPPDELGDIAFKWGIIYNAFVVIDITGGMGIATSRKMQELGYKNLYIDGIKTPWKYDPKLFEKIPGINFNSKRVQLIAALEEALRYGFIIRSIRAINEFNTFIYKDGKPDHQKGQHSDIIMALAMAIYIGDISFTQLAKAENVTKAMIDSWTVHEKAPSTGGIPAGHPQQYRPGTYDPFFLSDPANQNQQPTTASKEAYRQFGWLFGKKK